jgi:thiamine-monophosphate kinase
MSLGPEDSLHAWLRRRLQRAGFDRVGDDAAILPTQGDWAVTQDQQIEGVHFSPGLDPRLVARRLLAVNLSDLAAMGAEPSFAFLALSCPCDFDARRFLESFIAACGDYLLELAGGDLARNDKVTTSLTLLGTLPSGGRWVLRSSARPGDHLYLAGAVGLSALGRHLLEAGARVEGRRIDLSPLANLSRAEQRLGRSAIRAHLSPRPRLDVGRWLRAQLRAAAIDISDGLAVDLHRLCRESQVGATVRAESLPTSASFRSLCSRLAKSPSDLVMAGGEDYALLCAISPGVSPPPELACTRIGEITLSTQVSLESRGQVLPLAEAGWDHFRAET